MAQLSLPGVQPVARPEQAGASQLSASGRIEDTSLGSQSSGSGGPQRKELRPHQHRALDLLRRSAGSGNTRIVIQGPTGFGKCLGLDTLVVLASGDVVPVQDIKVGDRLASPTGDPVTVLSLARGREQMFRITPVKGEPWTCNASHLLSIKLTGTGSRTVFADGQVATGEKGQVITIRADDFWRSSKTAKRVSKQWRPSSVSFDGPSELLIPPYALGVWLGDGTSKRPDVSKPEGAVVDAWVEYAESVGCSVRVSSVGRRCPTYHAATVRGASNPALDSLRALNVIDNKHIPVAYKTASERNRLRLLAGLFDTDGYSAKGGVDFISKYESLANDVAFVCRSVGLAAYVKPCRKGIRSTGFVGDYWRVLVSGDCDKIPTRRLKIEGRRQVKDHLVTGFEIEPIGEGDYYGFEVTGDRLFLLGDFTVTHNTLVAARIIEMARAKGSRVIFTAPAISLIDQTVRAFEAEGLTGIGVMQASHPRTDRSAPIQVASVQTLARREIPAASLVIVDECHLRAAVIDRLMDERPDIFFVGLSATPWRKGMGRRWQDLVIPVTIGDLIEQGYLSRFRVLAPDVPDLSGVKTRQGDYVEADLEAVMGDAQLMGHVVETWLEHGAGRPTLLFGVNRAHAAALRASFERAGVAAGYVDAFTDGPERALLERQFRAGEVQVACSVRTLTTGVDWPVSCIIDAAPTQSEMLAVQKIGRGLRVNPGTEDLLVLDHAGNSLRLGLVTDIRHTALSSGAEDAPAERSTAERLPKPCPECGTLKAERTCPHCGHESKAGHGVEVAEGRLVEITGKAGRKAPPTRDEEQRFYSMALWMADERGYSEGWAAHKYRERFGVWPRNLTRDRAPADPAFIGWEKSRRIAWAKGRAKQEARA